MGGDIQSLQLQGDFEIVPFNIIASGGVCVAGIRLNNDDNKPAPPCSVNPGITALSSFFCPLCRWSNSSSSKTNKQNNIGICSGPK